MKCFRKYQNTTVSWSLAFILSINNDDCMDSHSLDVITDRNYRKLWIVLNTIFDGYSFLIWFILSGQWTQIKDLVEFELKWLIYIYPAVMLGKINKAQYVWYKCKTFISNYWDISMKVQRVSLKWDACL